MDGKLWYLASPYSHPDPSVMEQRFNQAQAAAVSLLKRGVYAFSPIAYNHPMVKFGLPTSWDFWRDYDKAFIKRCDGLIVLKLDGWDLSPGVKAEIEYIHSLNKPLWMMNLSEIEETNENGNLTWS